MNYIDLIYAIMFYTAKSNNPKYFYKLIYKEDYYDFNRYRVEKQK